MSTPWQPLAPAASKFSLTDHIGRLAFFAVGGLSTGIQTEHGTKDAVRVGVVLLDGPDAGAIFDDVLVFNVAPVARLRTMVGQITLARIIAEGKNNAPALQDPYPQDQAAAQGWYSYYPNKLAELLHATQVAHAEAERSKPAAQTWTQPALPNMPPQSAQPPAWAVAAPAAQPVAAPPAQPPPAQQAWSPQAAAPPPNATMGSLQGWQPNGAPAVGAEQAGF